MLKVSASQGMIVAIILIWPQSTYMTGGQTDMLTALGAAVHIHRYILKWLALKVQYNQIDVKLDYHHWLHFL
jgi:hypothetical protein